MERERPFVVKQRLIERVSGELVWVVSTWLCPLRAARIASPGCR
jgi:hypothetical protein